MNKNMTIPELNNEAIESMIYELRGVKVMLDFDLAKIYGYSTVAFNQQIKRNIEKFDNDFMFKLTNEEHKKILISQNVISSWGGRRALPYAFTEQGIYMLMTVLKGELATKQSKAIIRLFKQMKDYLVETNNLVSTNELLKLTNKVKGLELNQIDNNKSIEKMNKENKFIKKKLEEVMDNFIDKNTYKHFLLLNGNKIDATVAIQSIFKLAKHSIYLIDDYIDIKTLKYLKCCNTKVKTIIFSDNKNKLLDDEIINNFKKETNINITLKKNNNLFHGRYIVIDFNTKNYLLYHSGSSIKDAGNRIDTITLIDEKELYIDLIYKIMNN